MARCPFFPAMTPWHSFESTLLLFSITAMVFPCTPRLSRGSHGPFVCATLRQTLWHLGGNKFIEIVGSVLRIPCSWSSVGGVT